MEFETLPDNLFAGTFPVATEPCGISSGSSSFARGTVLGMVTATGKLDICDKSKSDGTQNPYAILAEDANSPTAAIAAVFTATLAGTPVADEVVTLVLGTKSYAYTVVASDTPTLVAAGLAALVQADGTKEFAATSSAAVITLTAVTAGVDANTISISVTAGDSGVTGTVARTVDGVDAVGIDATFPVYVTGTFNSSKLVFASGTTLEDMKQAMRNISLFVRDVVAA